MKSIIETGLVSSADPDVFISRLNFSINKMQDAGLVAEVQYSAITDISGNVCSAVYTAVVLGREK